MGAACAIECAATCCPGPAIQESKTFQTRAIFSNSLQQPGPSRRPGCGADEKGIIQLGVKQSRARRAVIDDFGDWFFTGLETLKLHPDHSEVGPLILSYYGCHICGRQDCDLYYSKFCEHSETPKLDVIMRHCTSQSRNCRYCGLTHVHHYNNRPLLLQRHIVLFDETSGMIQTSNSNYALALKNGNYSLLEHKYVGDPIDFPSMHTKHRCPIQTCANPSCGQHFVKVREHHLCTRCYVNFLYMPWYQQMWKPVHMHQYTDEILTAISTMVKSCNQEPFKSWIRVDSWRASRTYYGKHGKVINEYYQQTQKYVDVEILLRWLHSILNSLEAKCTKCHIRYRCEIAKDTMAFGGPAFESLESHKSNDNDDSDTPRNHQQQKTVLFEILQQPLKPIQVNLDNQTQSVPTASLFKVQYEFQKLQTAFSKVVQKRDALKKQNQVLKKQCNDLVMECDALQVRLNRARKRLKECVCKTLKKIR